MILVSILADPTGLRERAEYMVIGMRTGSRRASAGTNRTSRSVRRKLDPSGTKGSRRRSFKAPPGLSCPNVSSSDEGLLLLRERLE